MAPEPTKPADDVWAEYRRYRALTWWERLLEGITESPLTVEQRRVVLDLLDSFRKEQQADG